MCICMCVHMCVGAHRGQKGALDEVGVLMVACYQLDILEPEL